jgi:hypothetical protein
LSNVIGKTVKRLICLITAFAGAIQASGSAIASVLPANCEQIVVSYGSDGYPDSVTGALSRGKIRTYTYTDRGEIYYYSLPVVSINTEGEIWSYDGNATAHGCFKAGLSSGSGTSPGLLSRWT